MITLPSLQERVRTQHDEDVTRIGDEERSRLPIESFWRDAVRLYHTGLHPAIGLCIRHRGHVVLDRTIGHVENAPGARAGAIATPDTPFNLFSASKIVTGVVLMSLVEDGHIALSDKVERYLPEFANNGKERTTIRHLLNHTAGIPNVPAALNPLEGLRTGKVDLTPLYNLRPVTQPGRDVAYHPITSWLLLQEIVTRVTGKSLRELSNARLLEPLGFHRMRYGVDESEVHLVAKHARTGPAVPSIMEKIFSRTIGVDVQTAVNLTNETTFLTAILPSANVIGTGRETTRFLQMMLNGGTIDGTRVLDTSIARQIFTDLTPRQLDSTFGMPLRYGLGVMMGDEHFSLYGPGTHSAFGHLGFSGVVVFADPERDLVVSFQNTGKPMMAPGMLRWLWALQRTTLRVPKLR